jgi:hypothetical protein
MLFPWPLSQQVSVGGLHGAPKPTLQQVPPLLIRPDEQHCPLEQLAEQQSPLPLQVPLLATQQVVPEQVPFVGQVTQVPLQQV